MVRQVFPDGNEVLYSYDANGNMLGLTPPGRTAHLFAYNRDNKPTVYLPPLLDGDSTATQYIYDSEGRLARTVYPDSTFLAVTYDPIDGKQRAITYDRGTTTFNYDSTSGNLKQIIGAAPTGQAGDTLLYNYDGSMLLSEESYGEVRGKVGVAYDASFRVTSEIVNNADTVKITYDRDDLPTKIGAYAMRRASANELLLNDTVKTIITDYGYNTAGELISTTVKRSEVAIYSRAYTRDSLGRISALNETFEGIQKRYAYRYDSAGRLVEVKLNDTSQALYSYDANGNDVVPLSVEIHMTTQS